MLGIALELSSIDPAYSQATLARVASALETVRHVPARVEDPWTAAHLRSAADVLATASLRSGPRPVPRRH
jgi:hypothetical protein